MLAATVLSNVNGLQIPAERLDLTENAQPALMAVSVAVVRILEKDGGKPFSTLASYVAGHSLGEYSALAAAGALAFADALPLVRFRAQAMQDAVPAGVGAMAAIMGGGAVVGWHFQQGRRGKELPAQANPHVNLDIGEVVQVTQWHADGSARVVRQAVTAAVGALKANKPAHITVCLADASAHRLQAAAQAVADTSYEIGRAHV